MVTMYANQAKAYINMFPGGILSVLMLAANYEKYTIKEKRIERKEIRLIIILMYSYLLCSSFLLRLNLEQTFYHLTTMTLAVPLTTMIVGLNGGVYFRSNIATRLLLKQRPPEWGMGEVRGLGCSRKGRGSVPGSDAG